MRSLKLVSKSRRALSDHDSQTDDGVNRIVPCKTTIHSRYVNPQNFKPLKPTQNPQPPGDYKSLASLPLPSTSSPDYTAFLVYKTRSLIALDRTQEAISLIPSTTENIALKAIVGLAKYIGAKEAEEKEGSLEVLRDLCVEVEAGEWGEEGGFVRVLAGIAFFRAGEVEEALESLGAGTGHENLEACVPLVSFQSTWN